MNDDQKLHEQADQGDAAGGETAPETAGGELDRLTELEKELEEVRQHALYAQAETHNVRRRLEQEKLNASAYAVTGFAREMLSVKDNLDRALGSVPEELRQDGKLAALLAGIEATARELDAVFQRNGITRIDAMGVPLDPNRHQAMVEIPSEEAEPGTIVQEMQSGYMIKDRLLRPALVGVAKRP
ncbi:nucleotide exchange factor GrpE [Sphingomonas sp.]|uniref:nucleotide exchange factor GrpE n=1 Tax=Sphingomonas sp. TaxID=28214 RepID=UPI002FC81205